jgi:hypothetical protein
MAIEGWYYLHTNGDVIYKRETGGTAADIRESDFARTLWPFNPNNRAGAWRICVEAQALGASPDRVKDLAALWKLTDEDALHYADFLGARLFLDGNMWCATRGDFENLQESPAGFGETCLDALAALAADLGLKASKMWGATFHDLVK